MRWGSVFEKGICSRPKSSNKAGAQLRTETRGLNQVQKAGRRRALNGEGVLIKKGRVNQDGKLNQERDSIEIRGSTKKGI